MARTPHILIVDDDAEIRDLLTRYLVKNGLRASAVADGRGTRRRRGPSPGSRHSGLVEQGRLCRTHGQGARVV